MTPPTQAQPPQDAPEPPPPADWLAPTLPEPDSSRPYHPPELLRDLRLLDAVALTGTTEQAGRWLEVSQPTVSRRCRRLVEDFGLPPQPRQSKRFSAGTTISLRQLRLSARWHRFEAGVMVLASDPLHQGLLSDLEGQLPVPQRFRSGEAWLDLVRQGVIDAALVSSLELERPEVGRDPGLPWRAPTGADGVEVIEPQRLHLGHWPLRLAAPAGAGGKGSAPRLLVPPAPLAPGLRTLLAGRGLMVEVAAAAAHDLTVWRRRLETDHLATPVPADLLERGAGPLAGLTPLEGSEDLREHLWLLLPAEWPRVPVLRRAVEGLRRRAIAAGALSAKPLETDQGGAPESDPS